jgi:hypothetical protein
MECRICLEETPPFLQNICACRGTQQSIHEICLRQWFFVKRSTFCDICKEPFRISLQDPWVPPPTHLRRPWFPWLFQESTKRNLTLLLFGFLCFSSYEPLLKFQQFLHILYSISYIPILPTIYERPWYILQWCKPMLLLPSQHIIFPLPSLLLYIAIHSFPFFGAIVCLQNLFAIHVGIVEYLDFRV